MTSHSILAIIPARAGSKRLPKKNILKLAKKPLLAWTIEAAINSKLFDVVLVSTDDSEIAKISREYGADVPFLRKEGADDYTSASLASFIALKQAEDYWGVEFRNIAQLMANCPLRTDADIKESFESFEKNNCFSQISCFGGPKN